MASLEWLEDVQDRFRTDKTLFLAEELDVPSDAHLTLQSLSTPQICMMMLSETNTLTRMRCRAQFLKRRKMAQHLPGEAYVSCLHLIDLKYDLDLGVSNLTPAQLLCVGMRLDSTEEIRKTALGALRRRLAVRKRPFNFINGGAMKRSHSPTVEEAMAMAKAAKRSQSPNPLALNPTPPPRPIAPEPGSPGLEAAVQQPLASPQRIRRSSSTSPTIMEWVNTGRLAQAIWDPRLYIRQLDLARAMDQHIQPTISMPILSTLERDALRYSPAREKLPSLPNPIPASQPLSTYLIDSRADEEVLKYLYRLEVVASTRGAISWLKQHAERGLLDLMMALGKVLRWRREVESVWAVLEQKLIVRKRRKDQASRDSVATHQKLIRQLNDEAELAEFFCPNGKLMECPIPMRLRKELGDRVYEDLDKLARQWHRYDPS